MKKNRLFISLIVFIIALSIFSLCFFRIDGDYLWHIKAGEYMFNNGVLRHDIFSWLLHDKYWMSHEWLFEIIIFSLKKLFGVYHIFIYCFICILSLLLIIFITNKDNYMKNILFTIIWLAISLIICFHVQARPHLISYILLALTIYLLFDNYNNNNSKKIYFLPIISIIWSNIHGGSSNLIYLLSILFLICGLFEFKFKKIESNRISKLQLKRFLIVTILCMIGICINIHGFKMFTYPYINILNNTMLSNITEWRSTSLNELTDYIYFAFLLFIFIVLIISKNKIKLIDLVLFMLCIFLGLKSIRFWFYTYIIMSFVIFNYIEKRNSDKSTIPCLYIVSILFIGLFIARNNIFTSNYSFILNSDDISYIKSINSKRLFNMYDYGGDLIYNDILVFIDGRADLYSKYNYNDYLDITYLKSNSIDLIDKYDFDYFLVDSKYPINTYLNNNSNYELIYNRENILLYKKRT